MKQFFNILEAAEHHTKCYICGFMLTPNFRGDVLFNSPFNEKNDRQLKINLSGMVDSDTDDILTIDMNTNQITLHAQRRRQHIDYHYDIGGYLGTSNISGRSRSMALPSPRGYGGTIFEGIDISCRNCNRFSYTIQMIIDVAKEHKITSLFLNSEEITFNDGDTAHQIRNIYTTRMTEYRHHTVPHKFGKMISFPLIPLDLENPQETIFRIKKLLPFL
jgi:hypothetical protein